MQEVVDRIDGVMAQAAKSLQEAFAIYWPTYGNTGAHERNLSLHVACAFMNSGFAVFGEGHTEGRARQRYDVLACSQDRTLFVAAEFKLLWKDTKATEMKSDIERLREFKPVVRSAAAAEGAARVGLVGAFSEEDDRHKQLCERNVRGGRVAIRELLEALPDQVRWRTKPLCNHGWHPDRRGRLHLVYAVFPLHDDNV
ncbi:hypothetical protein ACSRUE_21335 [Sorangium sp. KYC3313]|uniref:hypothetical protein n=1 Tax=Sorangium sp. KYC3313 TaxID=3449740 RepID=UPI003F897E43